jgi:uncharacterized protein
MPHKLKFHQLRGIYSIVRLARDAPIPDWAMRVQFVSITRTGEELSIVCRLENIPEHIDTGPRWTCLKLEGPFPFSQIGVLLSFIEPLSKNGVPIFAISTHDTDYVLVQEEYVGFAVGTLRRAGHELVS